MSRLGYQTTAFDISSSAIEQCRKRFPDSRVEYVALDLFAAPPSWTHAFVFVLEAYTRRCSPPELRLRAARAIASFVALDGILLVIARARSVEDPVGEMPWPLVRDEILAFNQNGLRLECLEDHLDAEYPPVRRFRAAFTRPRV